MHRHRNSFEHEQGGESLLASSNTVDATGRVREATSTGSAQMYTYDDSDRLKKAEDTVADSCTTRVYGFSGDSDRTSLTESTNYYDSGDGAPAWTETKNRPDAATGCSMPTWNRHVSGLGGVAIFQGSHGVARVQLTILDDDIVATADIAGTGIIAYSEYTEYGLARDPANTPDRYGWLGTKQRDADTIGGIYRLILATECQL